MPSTRITDLATALADVWLDISEQYLETHEGRKLILTATYRSPEEQFRLYQQGRVQVADGSWQLDADPTTAVVTNCDGFLKRSRHNSNPAEALDFAVIVVGKISWDVREYAVVGRLAEARGLIWGGAWTKAPHDGPHLELPA